MIHGRLVLGRVLQLLGILLVNGWLANKGGRSSASRVYVHTGNTAATASHYARCVATHPRDGAGEQPLQSNKIVDRKSLLYGLRVVVKKKVKKNAPTEVSTFDEG